MTIQEEIFAVVTTQTSPLVTRAFPVSIPQGTEYPAARLTRISSVRTSNYQEGTENFVRTVFEVDSYGETFNDALALAENIKGALNNYAGGSIQRIRLDVELDIREDQTDLFRIMQQFTIWHTET